MTIMKRPSQKYGPTVGLLILGALSLYLVCCTHTNVSCDGKNCHKTLELEGKPSVMDSLFRADNPNMAKQFNVFVESSASMDGYVTGNTTFKTTLHRLIGQVIADVLVDGKSYTLNYVNSEIKNKPQNIKHFTQNLSPVSFSTAGGDRANSDIVEIISNVVDTTNKGTVSMFVSDCVYSPESASDIDQALEKQQTDMLNILKNKSKENKTFGVLLYRLISDFHGIYYTKTDEHIHCDGQRPYFVWFFGDESILANVKEKITQIMDRENALCVVGVPGYKYVPYKTIQSDHPYHFINAKSNEDSIFKFSFLADLSCLPLDSEYITNKANYSVGKTKYSIKKIEKNTSSDKQNDNYNYKYSIVIRGGRNTLITPTIVEISLLSELKKIPEWVIKYDDPKGEDYDNGYNPQQIRTFGLRSLVEGIADFYNESSYVTFKILIN